MGQIFSHKYSVSWGDLDSLVHMANVGYLNAAADTRMAFFRTHGLSMENFQAMRIMPVVLKDEVEYYRELHLADDFEVQLMLAGMNKLHSCLLFRNQIFRLSDNKIAASIMTTGGWLDLDKRSMVQTPQEVMDILGNLRRTEFFDNNPRPWTVKRHR